MSDVLNRIYELAVRDISESSPCGEQLRNDEHFDRVKTEIMKLTVSSGDSINWTLIHDNCIALLSEKTKDLTVTAYLSVALLRLHSYAGLQVGLRIVHHMLDTRWNDMFPPLVRTRARINAFEWINERVSLMVTVTSPGQGDVEALHECKALADELPEKVQKAVREPVTGFSNLRSELNNWAMKFPRLEPAPLPPPPATSEPGTAMATEGTVPEPLPLPNVEPAHPTTHSSAPVAPLAAAPSQVSAPQPSAQPLAPVAELKLPPSVESVASIKDGLKAIAKVIHLIREVVPLSPVPYRLARVVRWEGLSELPGLRDDGRTMVPAPLQQQLDLMAAQRVASKWALLTETAEHAFLVADNSLFDIDLQHLAFLGLSNRGAEAAAEVVRIETGRVLLRFPQILDLAYDSGKPFADGEARQWATTGMRDAAGSATSDEAERMESEWINNAHSVAQKKSLAEAIALVNEAIAQAGSERLRMKRQLAAAKFCAVHGKYEWAVPILQVLERKITQTDLPKWEPEFCAEVWDGLLRGHAVLVPEQQQGAEDRALARALRDRLYEVSLVKAVAITPKPKK